MLPTMHDLLTLLTTLPVLPFAIGLGMAVVYWIIALVSGIDLGSDGADGLVDGVADGALDGAADGALDGAADGALDGAADGAADGALDGAADGAADGATDGVAESWSMLALIASVLPIGRVPITVWVSLFSWWGFMLSLGSSLLLRFVGLQGEILASIGALFAVGLLSLPLSTRTSRPLEPLFRTVTGRSRVSLVGEVAEITTGRVDQRFGQARITLGGDELLVHVRCDKPANRLVRGSSALVVGFDIDRDAFIVEPMSVAHGEDNTTAGSVRHKPTEAVQLDG